MKNQKGITLIALVITIIVLLILAGVSIAMLTGDNGLLTKSTEVVPKNAVAGAKDEVNLIYQEALTEYLEGKYATEAASGGDIATIFGNKITSMAAAKKHGCTVTWSSPKVTITKTANGKTATSTGTLTTTSGSEKLEWVDTIN